MKNLLIPFAALALMLVGCNKDGTDTATGGNATPATSSSIVGKWYYPNELIDFKQQPEFDFKADGTVTGNYVGKWKINDKGVLTVETKDWEGKDLTLYMLPYTMYDGTVLVMRFDIPELTPDGQPVVNQGQGYVEFFYKDGKAAASNKADIQGTWENIESYDDNGNGTIDEGESMISTSVKFNGDKFDLIIHVWNGESYSGTYTYKDGFVYFHPTKLMTYEGEKDPKVDGIGSENGGDFVFPFIANGDEAYAYIIEGRGTWKKAK